MLDKKIESLDNLCRRLQDDYNNINVFNQKEEDRLVVYNVIETLENIKRLKKILNNETLDLLPFDVAESIHDIFEEIGV